MDLLHGVLRRLYARPRLGGGSEFLDDLSDLLLEFLDLLHVLVID